MTNYFTLQQIFCIPSQPFPPSRAAQMMILLGPVQCSSTFPRQADRHAANEHVKVGERKRQPRCCHAPPQRGKESSKRVSCRAPLVVVGVAEPRGRLAWPPACLIDLTRRSSTPAALLLYTVRTSSPAATSTCLWLSALFLSPFLFMFMFFFGWESTSM